MRHQLRGRLAHPAMSSFIFDLGRYDLARSHLMLLKDGHCFRDQVESICGKELVNDKNRSIQFESGSLETLKSIIDKRLGFTLLPELATLSWSELEKSRLRRFKGEKPVREVSLVVHRSF